MWGRYPQCTNGKLKSRDVKYPTEVLPSVSDVVISGDNNFTHCDSFLSIIPDIQQVTVFHRVILHQASCTPFSSYSFIPILHLQLHHFYISASNVWEFLHIISNSCYFLIVAILVLVKWYLIVVMNCMSQMIHDEHVFMSVLTICILYLKKFLSLLNCLLSSIAPTSLLSLLLSSHQGTSCC